ncbi:MAG: TetR/AcrR family transcriptional regulator [Parvularculaceae bacterium]
MNRIANPGRPRSFDETEALDAAMRAFWAHGFAGTSYEILEEATGLRRQSLRYAFGDKRALFEKALNHYGALRVGEIVEALDGDGSPLGNVKTVFDLWIEDAKAGPEQGCLMVNTSGELGRHDEIAAKAITSATRRLTTAFERAFRRAQDVGELSARHSAADLARLAVAAGDGALLHARVSGSQASAARAFRGFLSLVS